MVNTHRKHVKCFISKWKLFHKNRLEAHCQQYYLISMNKERLSDGILPPAGCDWPKSSWFDFSRCTWLAINELSPEIHLPIDNVPGAPPPEDSPDEETIDPQMPDLTCTLIHPRRGLIGRQLEWKTLEGKHMAEQLDCATSITGTQNNGIHGILFSQHTTFNRLKHLASKRKCG